MMSQPALPGSHETDDFDWNKWTQSFGTSGRFHRNTQNAQENLAIMRNLARIVFRKEKTKKCGAKGKRLICAMDHDYFLTSSISENAIALV